MNRHLLFAITLAAIQSAAELRAADWNQFRGPTGQGISDATKVPLEWGPNKNIRWRTPLPAPGNSSPIVSGNRVFVTDAQDNGAKRSLLCFDRANGQLLWERTVEFTPDEPTHETNPYCGSSPAADGERVVAWHSSAGLFCHDFDGKLLWSRDLGKFIHIWGYGASPIFHGDRVIVNCGPGERTFVVAVDKRTGETLWQADEPGGASGLEKTNPTDERAPWIGSWSTPMVAQVDGNDQILVSFPHHVKALNPATGKVLWTCDGLGDLVYTSVMLGEGIGVAMGGYMGPAIGFRVGGSGDVTSKARMWRVDERNPQRIGSGIIQQGYLYMANEPGIAQCIDVRTGEEKWRTRMPGGTIWGSMVLADGRFYVTNQEGETLVFAPDPAGFRLLARNPIGEPSNSTPAIADGELFLRTFEALYCIRE